ncbi:MAG: thioester reductase-like protein [Pirellulaceae bacterium]|jgi:thioester reductase-like protein
MKYALLTGATGLLGRYLLRDLTLAGQPLAVVVRPSRMETCTQRIETAMSHWEKQLGLALQRPVILEGDITKPLLGLTSQQIDWLTSHCDTMIHSAASLTFYSDETDKTGEPWRSNVEGTRNVLELCRQCTIENLHHVSTAYVCGRRRGRILESELDEGQEPSNDYEFTKVTAEKEVREAGIFDRVTIYRPSIIVGDVQTGFTTSYHGYYTPLRLAHTLFQNVSVEVLMEGDWLDGFQLQGDERKNLVPVDWVSAAMTKLIANSSCHGQTYHLTNPVPATVAEMVAAIGISLGPMLNNRQLTPLGATASSEIQSQELIASFREQMSVYQSYWNDDPDFDSQRTQAALPNLPCPAISMEAMQRLNQFAIDQAFGWPREQPAEIRHPIRTFVEPWIAGGEIDFRDQSTYGVVSLNISGNGGGQWHLILQANRLVAAGIGLRNGDGATCHLTSDTFSELTNGSLNWEQAVNAGKLLVMGEQVHPRQVTRYLCDLTTNPINTFKMKAN